ncbi:MAG TPA: 3'-5' exonuclease, partial [Pirellulales bacterium]
ADDIRAGKRRPRDFAIFYRVNALSRSLEFALRQHGIPYQMVNGLEFYQRKEIKDVLAYLRLINNPRDDNALLRIINTPARSIGKSTIDRLLAHASDKRLPMLEAARESGLIASLAKRTTVAVARFVAMIDRLMLVSGAPVEEILGHVLTESGYRALLEQSEDEEDQERLANLEELLTAARQFDEQHAGHNGLEGFLEEASLVADVDAWDADTDRATLMTLHASKGLEFPVVFIIALEEGLIPHERSRADDEAVEEERRLLFVGMTRTKEELQLSLGQYREFRGQRRMTIPSPFLLELPRDELRMIGFGPQTAADYRARMIADALDAADEGFEPEHLSADALDFEVHDIHADVEHLADSSPSSDDSPERQPVMTTLATAAELHDVAPRAIAPVSPDEFAHGMVVRHPEYGLGKIIALSGAGPRRVATVAFASSAGQKKFVLSQSQLRPVNSR